MTTTRKVHGSKDGGLVGAADGTLGGTRDGAVLYVAFELSEGTWKLAFGCGLGDRPWIKQVLAGDREAVLSTFAKARQRFGLDASARIVSCYEAGRDGFWVHRWLCSVGVENHVMDSSSIEVSRRQRRAKTDELDADSLLRVLIRKMQGEARACRFVQPPSEEDEDRRQLPRGRLRLRKEQTSLTNVIRAKLTTLGIDTKPDTKSDAKTDAKAKLKLGDTFEQAGFVRWLDQARDWQGKPIGKDTYEFLRQTGERLELATRQLRELEASQRERIFDDTTPHVEKLRRLLMFQGIGFRISWVLVQEVFGWRKNLTRKQLGSLAGLTPTPYDSGTMRREQGISKAGNRRLRQTLVELAWLWVRHQPDSALSKWFRTRFGQGARQRKIGIVALARKLLIALYRYAEGGEVPQGARTVEWQEKVSRPRRPRRPRRGGKAIQEETPAGMSSSTA